MSHYLSYRFEDNTQFINTFDELPLWSAPFGLLLLKHLELKPGLHIMDIGSGAGFPVMELAGRAGHSCRLYGLDTWANANERARTKIRNYELDHVEIIEASAANIPFNDGTIDLMVSNLGINNFDQPAAVFRECCRVLKPRGKLAITTNLYGHWRLFYNVFYETLEQLIKTSLIPGLKAEEERRGTITSISSMFEDNGFEVTRCYEEQFEMKFLDGTAFLNHYFVKLGWLGSWFSLFPKEELPVIFPALERNLNTFAANHNGLVMTVPMAFIEGEKAG